MNNDENTNPYQTSMGSKLFQQVISSFGRVLLTEERAGCRSEATRADCITGTSSMRITLYQDIVLQERLPRFIKIAYVKTPYVPSPVPFGQYRLYPKLFGDRVLEFILAGIESLLPNSRAKATGFNTDTDTAFLEVVVEDQSIVEREYLPTTFEIEYVIQGG